MPELRLTPAEPALAEAQQAMTRKDLAAAVLAFERAAKAGASVK
jgi:protein O-GlcNAc transferase